MPEPTPADRAVRALADAVGESRPRRPEDGDDPDVPVAATVVIVRDGPAGPEVLMIERPDRGSFAGAWVFPGGKLEPADRRRLRRSRPPRARRAGARETGEETGLRAGCRGSRRRSPAGTRRRASPLRIRTWFFLASDPGGELALAPDEVDRRGMGAARPRCSPPRRAARSRCTRRHG